MLTPRGEKRNHAVSKSYSCMFFKVLVGVSTLIGTHELYPRIHTQPDADNNILSFMISY